VKKAVVLLSGGLDSTVNLYWAKTKFKVVLALTFDYGQRAARSEVIAARALARKLGVRHQVVKLPFIGAFGQSSLTDKRSSIPVGSKVSIDSLKTSRETAKSVWVPNRNGIFLNVAAGFAETNKADYIIPGFNAEEAATFPDNSESFLKATDKTLAFSTANKVKIQCLTVKLSKAEIVLRGEELKVDWSLTWPCYFSAKKWCGQCESCQRSKRAFAKTGVTRGLKFHDEDKVPQK
jgi:7-cyano-7-deazaguanine synthase